MNQSKVRDPRFWKKWAASGAVGTFIRSTLMTPAEHQRRCEREGIDYSRVCVMSERWAQSSPRRSRKTRSALVRCDLICRNDGSVVFLDGAMAFDSVALAKHHMCSHSWRDKDWGEYVEKITQLPSAR